MTDDLEKAALDAIQGAAERLGVDPYRLARFLAHGRIAEFLQALGRAGAPETDRATGAELAADYLEFLEEEMRLRGKGRGPSGAANGG